MTRMRKRFLENIWTDYKACRTDSVYGVPRICTGAKTSVLKKSVADIHISWKEAGYEPDDSEKYVLRRTTFGVWQGRISHCKAILGWIERENKL